MVLNYFNGKVYYQFNTSTVNYHTYNVHGSTRQLINMLETQTSIQPPNNLSSNFDKNLYVLQTIYYPLLVHTTTRTTRHSNSLNKVIKQGNMTSRRVNPQSFLTTLESSNSDLTTSSGTKCPI